MSKQTQNNIKQLKYRCYLQIKLYADVRKYLPNTEPQCINHCACMAQSVYDQRQQLAGIIKEHFDGKHQMIRLDYTLKHVTVHSLLLHGFNFCPIHGKKNIRAKENRTK